MNSEFVWRQKRATNIWRSLSPLTEASWKFTRERPGPRQPAFPLVLVCLAHDRRLLSDPYGSQRPSVRKCAGAEDRSAPSLYSRRVCRELKFPIIYIDLRLDYKVATLQQNKPEVAQMEARLETANARWILADADQRSTWLERMDTVSRKLARMNGSEPRRGFLLCLAAILESAREMKSTQPGKQNAWDWRSDASWTPAGRAMQASEEPDQGCLTK